MQLYLIIALVWIASMGGAYWKGGKNAENAAAAKHAVALEETIKQARENAVIDMNAAVEAEQARQKSRVEFRDRVVTVERLINAKPSPAECRIADDALGVFRDAINNANGAKTATEPPKLPATPPTERRPLGHTSAELRTDY